MTVFSYECPLHKEIFEELIGELEPLLGAVNFPPGGAGEVSLVVHLAKYHIQVGEIVRALCLLTVPLGHNSVNFLPREQTW